jgi:phosphoribosyl-AMP cyclohydrolase
MVCAMSLLNDIKYNEAGLVPAIAQDATTGRVLMMAWMNAEAITRTLETGYAHYYSRSRGKQWQKGETSGHEQRIVDIYLDCDGDTLLLKVEQTGPACHTNRESCFYRQRDGENWKIIEEPMV